MKRVWMLILVPLLAVFANIASAQSAYPGEIVNDRVSIKNWESGSYVFTIGEIQNNSDATLDDIVVEARYFDADGELIDVTVERLYSLRVPPAESVAFRLQSLALAEQEDYVSHQVRLISANESRPCAQSSGGASNSNLELIKKLLISSFPILLLIALWIFFMRRFGGKNSPQNRSLDLIDKQNEMIEKQNSAIDRIANALEADKDEGRRQ
jgi:ATP-dependent Zn protease